jgi:hypothetical protein
MFLYLLYRYTERVSRYRLVMLKEPHPMGRKPSTNGRVYAWEHRILLFDAIGWGPHPCHWCTKAIDWKEGATGVDELTVDHLNGVEKDNRLANLVPSCRGCNAHRRRRVRDDEPFIVRDGKRLRATERICQFCETPFLVATTQLRNPTYGRYCSGSCRAKGTWAKRQSG